MEEDPSATCGTHSTSGSLVLAGNVAAFASWTSTTLRQFCDAERSPRGVLGSESLGIDDAQSEEIDSVSGRLQDDEVSSLIVDFRRNLGGGDGAFFLRPAGEKINKFINYEF